MTRKFTLEHRRKLSESHKGQFDNKCPDFINCNGEKIAIEAYYRRHKQQFRGDIDTWKNERQGIFNKYGWNIIFFDETEVNDDNILRSLGG